MKKDYLSKTEKSQVKNLIYELVGKPDTYVQDTGW